MTRRTLLANAVLVLLAGGVVAAERPTAPAPRPTVEPIDLLYLSDARPVVVRLRVTSDGNALSEGWDKFAATLFTQLDANKNGVLDGKETERLRPTVTLLTGRIGIAGPDAGKSMSREDVAEYLRKSGLLPFSVPPGQDLSQMNRRQPRIIRGGNVITTEELDKGLMELLDTNKDGKLSATELAVAADILLQLDADENEMLTAEEILKRPPPLPFFVQQIDDGSAQSVGAELALLGRKGPDAMLARRLLFRYGMVPMTGRNPNADSFSGRPVPSQPPQMGAKKRLTPQDIKLDPEDFKALDQDGDGELDAEELARYGSSAVAEIELAVRFGSLPYGRKAVEVIRGGSAPVTAFATGPDVALEVPGVRLDIASGGDRPREFRAGYRNRFRNLDRDGNGYLDDTESRNDPVIRDLFSFLDRDGDGKVFEKELTAALDEVEPISVAAERGLAGTDVAEAGRGLFGLIDLDGDNRLSLRELKSMPGLISRFDRNKDGHLSPGEVPRRFRVTFTRGASMAANPFGPARVRNGMENQPTLRPPVGPMWFQKMDRNRDGDVSRREFLGTDEEFRRLDADGDGLIDVKEAEAATTSADRR